MTRHAQRREPRRLGARRPGGLRGTLTLGDDGSCARSSLRWSSNSGRRTTRERWLVSSGEARGSHGIVINLGAWTHYSYAIHDALEAVEDVPKVETHLSNVHAREPWRRHSLISPAVDAVVAGLQLRLRGRRRVYP